MRDTLHGMRGYLQGKVIVTVVPLPGWLVIPNVPLFDGMTRAA